MISKIFIDTNIIIDILLERKPFSENSEEVISAIARKNHIPFISGSSITDLYYICRKAGIEADSLLKYLNDLLENFDVLIIDKDVIIDAISSGLKDFEDAVQIMACKKEKIDLIITRDQQVFKNKWIKVQTPEEYLNTFSQKDIPESR